jgi:PTH1 family peptidyl-tRNA hydrolase
MNLSGVAVKKACAFYAITPREIIVLHDDLETKFGQLKIKNGGSGNGHNGLRSIISALGEKEFERFKIGIGRPSNNDGAIDSYVMAKFSPDQNNELSLAVYPEIMDVLFDRLARGPSTK